MCYQYCAIGDSISSSMLIQVQFDDTGGIDVGKKLDSVRLLHKYLLNYDLFYDIWKKTHHTRNICEKVILFDEKYQSFTYKENNKFVSHTHTHTMVPMISRYILLCHLCLLFPSVFSRIGLTWYYLHLLISATLLFTSFVLWSSILFLNLLYNYICNS